MSTDLDCSFQLNDEQIEDLVREYSQFEENSQAFIESQSQSYTEDLPQPANQDFQAEFLKCMFTSNQLEQIATNARATHDTNTQPDIDSQTDVETVVRTFITDNPRWNNNVATTPIDIETFLETRDFFVTVKSTASNCATNSVTTAVPQNERDKEKNKRFTLGPLPIEIEDVQRMKIDPRSTEVWRSYQNVYGQRIRTVMFYGRCKPCGSKRAQRDRNVRLYEVDDGSGMVIVHFPHFDTKYSALSRSIERLLDDYTLAQREGIAFLGAEHCGPNTAKCQEMLTNINTLINIIRRNGAIKQDFLTHGCKVCVVGRVFGHIDGTNHVFAYNMIEDIGVDREFEIKFKHHLISVYQSKYMKYRVDGEAFDAQTE